MTKTNLTPTQRKLHKRILRNAFDNAKNEEAKQIISLVKSLKYNVLAEEMQNDLDSEQEINHCKIQ